MKLIPILLAALLPLTTGCGLREHGVSATVVRAPQDTIYDCGDFTFTDQDGFRVTPNGYGPNSLMVHSADVPGVPRALLFTVSETDGFGSGSFGEEMQRIEKSPINFWNETTDVQGDFRKGKIFSGMLPEVSRKRGNATVIQRPAIGFAGQVKTIGTRKYLLLYTAENHPQEKAPWRGFRIHRFSSFSREVRAK